MSPAVPVLLACIVSMSVGAKCELPAFCSITTRCGKEHIGLRRCDTTAGPHRARRFHYRQTTKSFAFRNARAYDMGTTIFQGAQVSHPTISTMLAAVVLAATASGPAGSWPGGRCVNSGIGETRQLLCSVVTRFYSCYSEMQPLILPAGFNLRELPFRVILYA